MASSLIQGLLANGISPESIWAADIDGLKLQQLRNECRINTGTSGEIAQHADVLVLAVKPQVMATVCTDIQPHLGEHNSLVLSIAAGITIAHLQRWLGEDTALVRCMPNTPALVGKGASGLFANQMVSEPQKQLAADIMAAVGLSVWVDSEQDIDTVTALSGSGPAYFFLFMEAMQAAAQEMGLKEELARVLTYQTALGAAELALDSEDDIATLRQKVTSPGGTTEQAINRFEAGDLRGLVAQALRSARDRSIELADEFGKAEDEFEKE